MGTDTSRSISQYQFTDVCFLNIYKENKELIGEDLSNL